LTLADACNSLRRSVVDVSHASAAVTGGARGGVHPISVAPMMDCTDRHFRWFMRQISRRALLYSEMVTMGAVIHGDREYLLGFSPEERPLALQLGGDDPATLAECARIAEGMGYDEVNLNVGCPSDRVASGNFGACLMARPERVAACVAAMRAAVQIPVTVKHRIGIDDRDAYEDMLAFVTTVAAAGCDRFTVHARKAVLGGLSPKENRTIPPLRHDDVHRLKAELPRLTIEINGGIVGLDAAAGHLQRVDGVMIGRAAYDDPYLFAEVDRRFYADDATPPGRFEVARRFGTYAARWLASRPPDRGGKLSGLTRHVLGLFAGMPGAREFRRLLTTPQAGPVEEVVERAVQAVERAQAARAEAANLRASAEPR
jgi:tRNA-dihydrouridine synthase A